MRITGNHKRNGPPLWGLLQTGGLVQTGGQAVCRDREAQRGMGGLSRRRLVGWPTDQVHRKGWQLAFPTGTLDLLGTVGRLL